MRPRVATLIAAALFAMHSSSAGGQLAQGAVRGEVSDSSGGVLPGVTIVAAAANGRVLATTATDGSGRYGFRTLPVGAATLTFQLEGFTTATAAVTVRPGAETRVAQRLELAPISQSVIVSAPAPVDPPARVAPPPRPRSVASPVPSHDRDSICGPAKPAALTASLGTIRSAGDDNARGLYAEGAELEIDGGSDNGLEVGRNLVARRYYRVQGGDGADVVGEHSAGLLQIVAATGRSSVAVVVYACGELRRGDFLAPFQPEPVRDPDPFGAPAYYDAARILFADESQTLGAPRRLMVIDHGAERGTRPGQRFTLFRKPRRGPATRELLGDAVVVAVRIDSATIRVDRATDAIAAGDWAAPHKAPSPAR